MKKFHFSQLLITASFGLILITLTLLKLTPTPNAFASATSAIGYLDQPSNSVLCQQITGWACDTTDPSKQVQVDFYAPNPYSSGVHAIAVTPANETSGDEAAIAAFCGAATGNKTSYAHRFTFHLPASLETGTPVALYVYAHALDGTHVALLGHSGIKATCTAPPPVSPDVSPDTSPSPTDDTVLSVALQLPGIGVGGNLSPHHTTRTLHLNIYASDADPTQPNVTPLFDNKTITLTYNSTTGYFTNAAVNVGNLSTGDYQILVKVPGYLRKEFTTSTSGNTITITSGKTTLVPVIKLIPGDVAALYNTMDVADFYAIAGCYKDKVNSSTCSIGAQMADINDDGVVDGIDINYWLLGYQAATANMSQPSVEVPGDGVPGD